MGMNSNWIAEYKEPKLTVFLGGHILRPEMGCLGQPKKIC